MLGGGPGINQTARMVSAVSGGAFASFLFLAPRRVGSISFTDKVWLPKVYDRLRIWVGSLFTESCTGGAAGPALTSSLGQVVEEADGSSNVGGSGPLLVADVVRGVVNVWLLTPVEIILSRKVAAAAVGAFWARYLP